MCCAACYNVQAGRNVQQQKFSSIVCMSVSALQMLAKFLPGFLSGYSSVYEALIGKGSVFFPMRSSSMQSWDMLRKELEGDPLA